MRRLAAPAIAYVALETEHQSPIFVDYFEDWDYSGEEAYVPHRHDYHEILCVESGFAQHTVDGRAIELPPQSIVLVTRGQIHLITAARSLTGRAIGFKDDALFAMNSSDHLLILLNQLSRPDYVLIPPAEAADYASLIELLVREYTRDNVANKRDFMQFLLNALLIRIQRLYEISHQAQSGFTPLDYQRYQAFITLLEAQFVTHHNVGFYADSLHLSPNELSKVLYRTIARSPKALINERILLEAKRLLQFTSLSVKAIAEMLGYQDRYHFGKVFKQVTGMTPLGYRKQWQIN